MQPTRPGITLVDRTNVRYNSKRSSLVIEAMDGAMGDWIDRFNSDPTIALRQAEDEAFKFSFESDILGETDLQLELEAWPAA